MKISLGQPWELDGQDPNRVEALVVDPVALWHQLPDDAKERLGASAVAHVLADACEQYGNPTSAVSGTFLTASAESLGVMASVVGQHLVEAGVPELMEAPFIPDLNRIGVRSCSTCGCTEAYGCSNICSWVGETLCSTCAEKPGLVCETVCSGP